MRGLCSHNSFPPHQGKGGGAKKDRLLYIIPREREIEIHFSFKGNQDSKTGEVAGGGRKEITRNSFVFE